MAQARIVSTYLHAPTNIGFIYSSPTQFTHFAGSEAGVEDTFGLSTEKLLELFIKFFNDVSKEVPTSSDNESKTDQAALKIVTRLEKLTGELVNLVQTLKQTQENESDDYRSLYTMSAAVVATGHIPLILSNIAPAAQYERATRSITGGDLSTYFERIPDAKEQVSEFLTKHKMMQKIGEFRQELHELRYTFDPKKQTFCFCNRLLVNLDDSVIKINQNSLPHDYVQFDLFTEFAKKIVQLTYHIDKSLEKTLIADILKNVRDCCVRGQSTYDMQEKLAGILYGVLERYISQQGLDKEGDIDLSEEQENILQSIFPLLAYLNSEQNPFARDGLYGKWITNSFHTEALVAYKLHESKRCDTTIQSDFSYQYRPSSVEFNEDQMEKLLYGSENDLSKPKSSSQGFFGRLIGQDSNSDSKEQKSLSQIRRELLALPMPVPYLQLTYKPSLNPPSGPKQ